MEISQLSQELKSMVAQLELLCPGHDWHYEPGDSCEDTVRRSFKAYAPQILAELGRQMQPAVAAAMPEGMAPWRATVTANGVTFRQL
jgi:hypothetical protein